MLQFEYICLVDKNDSPLNIPMEFIDWPLCILMKFLKSSGILCLIAFSNSFISELLAGGIKACYLFII